MAQNTENLTKIAFAAIDRYVEVNSITNEEKTLSGKPFILWGTDNIYPYYIRDLYDNVSTLHSIIDGTVDFICGDSVSIDDVIFETEINNNGTILEDFIRDIAFDLVTYGGFAINIVRNKIGNVAGLYHIPILRLRTNDDKTTFYYSSDWTKSYGRVKYAEYPKFDKNDKNQVSSVYYYSSNNLGVYPVAKWAASTKACEIEKMINEYHINAINNGFSASYLINFNNGLPNDQQKAEAENYVNEKLAGSYNAGRILLNFANDKDHSAELIKLDTDDYGEKYKSLATRTRQEIFTAFRANPNLFGITTEGNGFANEQYEESFRLYNRTAVRPLQNVIARAINFITNKTISITPFTMDEEKKDKNIVAE